MHHCLILNLDPLKQPITYILQPITYVLQVPKAEIRRRRRSLLEIYRNDQPVIQERANVTVATPLPVIMLSAAFHFELEEAPEQPTNDHLNTSAVNSSDVW